MLYQHVVSETYPRKTVPDYFRPSKSAISPSTPSAIVNYHHNSLESRLDAVGNNLALDHLDAGMGAEIMFSARKNPCLAIYADEIQTIPFEQQT